MKIEKVNEETRAELDAEIDALKKVGVYKGHFEKNYTSYQKRYLFMSHAKGPTVFEYLKSPHLTDSDKLTLCQNIVTALSALHKDRIIFTDIKTVNMIIDPATKKITFIDFGKSVIMPENDEAIQNSFIKKWYSHGFNIHIAPEINEGGQVSFLSDVWLLGYRIFAQISFDKVNLQPLCEKMMELEPKNRINLEMVENYLKQLENELGKNSYNLCRS